jgi:hypothetical protein
MNTIEWLEFVANIMPSDIPDDDEKIYVTKFNGEYITRVGMEDNIAFLADREITEQLTHGVGFSPKDNKWYGWSHRAIYGFTVGSTCEEGNCHYQPKDKEDFLRQVIVFWSDPDRLNVKGEYTEEEIMYSEPVNPGEAEQKSVSSGKFQKGIYVSWTYNDTIPNEKLHNTISGVFTPYPDRWGKGEWTAKTMEDAKQMAIDFNESVS